MRVMIASDAPIANTGTGRWAREIAPAFDDVVYCSWFVNQKPPRNLPIFSAERGNPKDIAEACQYFRPDRLLLLGDSWYFANIPHYLPYCPVVIAWLTIDSPMIGEEMLQSLRHTSLMVATSRYGHKTLVRHGFNDSQYIPLGVNPAIFYPEEDLAGYLLMVGNNQMRKNLAQAIEISAVTGMQFVIKTNILRNVPGQPFDGCDLLVECEQYGLNYSIDSFDEQVVFLVGGNYSEDSIRSIYNGCSMYVHTAGNEGFGLPVIEARACSKPAIGLNCTAHGELLTYGIEPDSYLGTPPFHKVYSANIDKWVDALSRRHDPMPLPPYFNWDVIRPQIRDAVLGARPYHHMRNVLVTHGQIGR